MSICKYCKSRDHIIDNCPDILCKICNKKGHPHWKCTLLNKKVEKKEIKKKNIKEMNIPDSKIVHQEIINIINININNVNNISDIKEIPWGNINFM